MKTKIAMAISFAGVLVAGSAAALVNTQVLGGTTSAEPLAVDQPLQTQPTQPSAPVTTTVTTPVVAAPVAAAPVSTQAVYAIGDSGTVTLDTAGDVLTITNVTPAAGWVVTKSENQDSTNVEIKFQGGTTEVEFHANLLFGVVTTSVDAHDDSVANGSVTSSPAPSARPSGGDDSGSDDHGGGGDDD